VLLSERRLAWPGRAKFFLRQIRLRMGRRIEQDGEHTGIAGTFDGLVGDELFLRPRGSYPRAPAFSHAPLAPV
jgi:hypothetical protein